MDTTVLPIAVIGAGPVGLAAMAQLLAAGEDPVGFESGTGTGTAVSEWSHVRLFTPWEYNLDAAATSLLVEHGWVSPDLRAYPTGREFLDRYLLPLAQVPALAGRLQLGARVISVTRAGFDKMKSAGRREAAFVLRVVDADGERDVVARAVIDASGTWFTPNPIGGGGVLAIGEPAAIGRTRYGIPDFLGTERARYAGRRVLIVGSGHSAFSSLTDLATLAEQEPRTRIHWAVRRPSLEAIFGPRRIDPLPERVRLAERVDALVTTGTLSVHTGVRIDRLMITSTGVRVFAASEIVTEVDEIVVATGFRPDRSLLSELRVALDTAIESPVGLAPLIDPNVHNCGSVPRHGAQELIHLDEPGLFIVGMKSYGRAPTALMSTAYEQVRSVVAALQGDWKMAREVRLAVPEVGPCVPSSLDVCDGPSSCGPPVASAAVSDLRRGR